VNHCKKHCCKKPVCLVIYKQKERGEAIVTKSTSMNLQDVFLNQLRRDRMPLTVYLTNGFQLKGIIKGFDNFVIVIEADGKQQVVYKHAVSTISPMHPMNLIFQDEKSEN